MTSNRAEFRDRLLKLFLVYVEDGLRKEEIFNGHMTLAGLGVDSLAFLELQDEIDDEFFPDNPLPEGVYDKLKTVHDLEAMLWFFYVKQHVDGGGETPNEKEMQESQSTEGQTSPDAQIQHAEEKEEIA